MYLDVQKTHDIIKRLKNDIEDIAYSTKLCTFHKSFDINETLFQIMKKQHLDTSRLYFQ